MMSNKKHGNERNMSKDFLHVILFDFPANVGEFKSYNLQKSKEPREMSEPPLTAIQIKIVGPV